MAHEQTNRWEINKQNGITLAIGDRLSHHDHIEMSLRKIHAFGEVFDIEVLRIDSGLKVVIQKDGNIYKKTEVASGETVSVEF